MDVVAKTKELGLKKKTELIDDIIELEKRIESEFDSELLSFRNKKHSWLKLVVGVVAYGAVMLGLGAWVF